MGNEIRTSPAKAAFLNMKPEDPEIDHFLVPEKPEFYLPFSRHDDVHRQEIVAFLVQLKSYSPESCAPLIEGIPEMPVTSRSVILCPLLSNS